MVRRRIIAGVRLFLLFLHKELVGVSIYSQSPDWFLLISAWLKKGRYGLTLPFLAGARAHLNQTKDVSEQHVKELLAEMILFPVRDQIIHVRWCSDYCAPVFATYAYDSPYRLSLQIIEIKNDNNEHPSIIIEKSVASNLGVEATRDTLLSALCKNALGPVLLGHFSKRWTEDGVCFEPLHDDDIKFIREALTPRNS